MELKTIFVKTKRAKQKRLETNSATTACSKVLIIRKSVLTLIRLSMTLAHNWFWESETIADFTKTNA